MQIVSHNPFRIFGVFSNSGKKEITKNKTQIKRFANVGKTISFPLDCNEDIERTPAMLELAESQLTLPLDFVHYSLFWFQKSTPLDEIAFEYLFQGNSEAAIEIWNKKDCVSSLLNKSVLYFLQSHPDKAISCAETLFERFGDELTAMMSETVHVTTSELETFFLDTLLDGQQGLSEDILKKSITRKSWKSIVHEKLEGAVWSTFRTKLTEFQRQLESAQGINTDCHVLLLKVMVFANDVILAMNKISDDSSIEIRTIRDDLANLLGCVGNAYYETSVSDQKSVLIQCLKAENLALSIACSEKAKEQSHNNIETIENLIANLLPESAIQLIEEVKRITNQWRHTSLTNPDEQGKQYLIFIQNTAQKLNNLENPVFRRSQAFENVSNQIVVLFAKCVEDVYLAHFLTLLKTRTEEGKTICRAMLYRLDQMYRCLLELNMSPANRVQLEKAHKPIHELSRQMTEREHEHQQQSNGCSPLVYLGIAVVLLILFNL